MLFHMRGGGSIPFPLNNTCLSTDLQNRVSYIFLFLHLFQINSQSNNSQSEILGSVLGYVRPNMQIIGLYPRGTHTFIVFLGSIIRLGYCIPVPDFYLVLHDFDAENGTLMDLSIIMFYSSVWSPTVLVEANSQLPILIS